MIRDLDLPTITLKAFDRVPENLRWGVRDAFRVVWIAASRASVWRWTAASLRTTAAPCRIIYVGRPESLRYVARFLSAEPAASLDEVMSQTGVVAEQPFPSALRVPLIMRLFVPLAESFEQTLLDMRWRESGSARRAIELAERARVVSVRDGTEAERVSTEMLEPYARARHGNSADQLRHGVIRHLALRGGLDLIYLDGEPVAARLGFSYRHQGKRCFQAFRAGYPRSVFEDRQRLSVYSALGLLLTIRDAHASGHDVLDWGTSPALPDDGQLQYKRRRGAFVSVAGCHRYLWVHLPAVHRAQLLWARPLFSVENGQVALNVGVPSTCTDSEVLTRFRTLTFPDLASVRLHAARAVAEDVVATLRRTYSKIRTTRAARETVLEVVRT